MTTIQEDLAYLKEESGKYDDCRNMVAEGEAWKRVAAAIDLHQRSLETIKCKLSNTPVPPANWVKSLHGEIFVIALHGLDYERIHALTTAPPREKNALTPKEMAMRLNGRTYGDEITNEEAVLAKAAGLVVAFGYSDDNLELRGAANDEIGAWNGQTVRFTKAGLLTNDCDNDDCPHFEKLKKNAIPLEIKWNDNGGPCWTFETAIPHETFEIYDEGELFCVGVVFALADVPS